MKRYRPASWFDRQLAHVRVCMAEAERQHTAEEVAAAEAALAIGPRALQQTLFRTTPNTGLIPGGQPEPSGLAGVLSLGI